VPQLTPVIKTIPHVLTGSSALAIFAIAVLQLFIAFFLAAGAVLFWALTRAGLADAIVGLAAPRGPRTI
jgi:hypothetical protein